MSTAKMYFIAVMAPEEVNNQVKQWKHYMREHYGCVVALRSPAHITLIPPFWMQDSLEKELIRDISSFAATQPSFNISLINFDAFRPKVIFVRIEKNESLAQLKQALEQYLLSLSKYPVKKESRPFHPHLTIANRDLRKKDFYPAFEHFSKLEYRASFAAGDMALLKHNGTEWTIAHRWNLETVG
jgi:2'-5' RNA ligase